MSILIVRVRVDLERRGLNAALAVYRAGFRLLLRDQRIYSKLPKLQIGFNPKQRFAGVDQRVPGSHAHVSCFDIPNDIILIASVRQVNFSRIQIKRFLAIVINIEIYLIAHLRVQIHPDILSHLKRRASPCPLR